MRYLSGAVLLMAAVCGAAAERPAGRAAARFHRVAEPRENAFTVLVPDGWQTTGGIVRVNPDAAGGAANAIAAKTDFAVMRDAQGTAMIRILPDVLFADVTGTPVAGLFPPGSNYNGATVHPVVDPYVFLSTIAFRYAHPQAGPPRVTDRRPLPSLVAEMRAGLAFNPMLANLRYGAGVVSLSYDEGGTRYTEKMAGGIVATGPQLGGLWWNQRTLLVRAPAAEFDALAAVFATIHNSVKINPQWLAGEIRGQMVRADTVRRLQQDIQRIEREIQENRARTNSEINNNMYLTLTGQEEYVNPHTGETERGTNEWKYRWVTPGGDVVYSNDEYYDPNHDAQEQRSGFKRSPVRPR